MDHAPTEDNECPQKIAAATLLGVRVSPRHFSSAPSSLNNSQSHRRTSDPNGPINDPDSTSSHADMLLVDESATSTMAASSGNSRPQSEQLIVDTPSSTTETRASTTTGTSNHNTTNYLSISSLGFGIGNSATAAAQQALQDATSRTHWTMPNKVHQQLPQLDIQLGVPASLPLHTSELELPLGVTSIHIVPGGLLVDGDSSSLHGPIVSVVACITLKIPPIRAMAGSMSTNTPSVVPSAPTTKSTRLDSMVIPEVLMPPTRAQSTASATSNSLPTTAPARTTNIEMLALLSESLVQKQQQLHRQQQEQRQQTTTTTTKVQRRTSASSLPSMTSMMMGRRGSASTNESSEGDLSRTGGSVNGSSGNYPKLAPGKTTKNHERLFVKHQYRDYSDEQPMSDEIVLQFTHMSPNAAFPLKLHETLSAVEKDGLASIIGWLPHGVRIIILQ